jgi:hypothetical protein
MSQVSPRVGFARREGFLLYTDVNSQLINAMSEESIPGEVSYSHGLLISIEKWQNTQNPVSEASVALHAVVNQMAVRSPALNMPSDEFYKAFGVREQSDSEAARSKGMFQGGFGDRQFPWHFSAALANGAVQSFVVDGHLTNRQASRLTLTDWANLMADERFSRLAHAFAFTANGVYQNFGQAVEDYRQGSLREKLYNVFPSVSLERKPFLTGYQLDPADGNWYLAARMHPSLRSGLRKKMQDSNNSTGCPVARRSARVPASFPRTNPHLARLAKAGILSVTPEVDGRRVQVEQEQTAIDRTLQLIAGRLALYDQQYGTPVFRRHPNDPNILFGTRHARRKPTQALWRAHEPTQARQLS